MKIKAIGLVSGGLDSMIATKLMLEQKIDVFLIMFASPFFHSDLCLKKTIEFMGLKVKVIGFGNEYFEIIKNPEHGYGSGMNPCIDCKIYMFKTAEKIMKEKGASFIFTGEVLNQRPFSQTKSFIDLIEKKSGLKGKILRPLSARLLKPTLPEIEGFIEREKLLGISGRSRKEQLYIAQQYGITGFSQPAGGCLLTDPIYSKKLKTLITKWKDSKIEDAELIKHGRIFWNNDILIVIGRNRLENEQLLLLKKEDDFLIYPESVPGPSCIVRGKNISSEILEYAKNLVLHYIKKAKVKNTEFKISGPQIK